MQTPEQKSADTTLPENKQEQPSELPAAWRHFLESVQRHYGKERKE